MPTSRRTLLKNAAAAAAALNLDWTRARAEAETVRLGVIYDLTGPFAELRGECCVVDEEVAGREGVKISQRPVMHEVNLRVVREFCPDTAVSVSAVQNPGVRQILHVGTPEEFTKYCLWVAQCAVALKRLIQDGSDSDRASLSKRAQLRHERAPQLPKQFFCTPH